MGGHNYYKGKDNLLGVTEGGESVGLRHLEGGKEFRDPLGDRENILGIPTSPHHCLPCCIPITLPMSILTHSHITHNSLYTHTDSLIHTHSHTFTDTHTHSLICTY